MIHPGPGVKIFVATSPVDFRKGHDGLAALVQSHLRHKPFDRAVYVFRAKRADRLKLIYWDGFGLVMSYRHRRRNSLTRHVDLSRFGTAPRARLSRFPFESDGAFPAQC